MDLEDELRQAMTEHVREMSASPEFADEAKRRHYRTMHRRAAIAVTAAGLVVAIAAIPTYHSFRPETVGSKGPGGQHRNTNVLTVPTPSPPAPILGGRGTPEPGHSHTAVPPSHPSHGHITDALKAILGYVPAGIGSRKTCQTQREGTRETTTCRWTGSAGWIEVRVVRDSGLNAPADLGLATSLATKAVVNGHAGLLISAVPSQLAWIEQHGLGVYVQVSQSLNDRLSAIADGVRVGG
jgi:hypothetical protein